MTITCRRCNRPLKNLNSILAGLGPVCAAKNAAEEAMREAETPPDFDDSDIPFLNMRGEW